MARGRWRGGLKNGVSSEEREELARELRSSMFRSNSKHQYRPDLNDSDGDDGGQEKDSGSPPRGSSPPPSSSSGMDSASGSGEMDRGGPKERGTTDESVSNGGVKADGGGGSPQSEPASGCSGAPVAEGTGNLNDKVDGHTFGAAGASISRESETRATHDQSTPYRSISYAQAARGPGRAATSFRLNFIPNVCGDRILYSDEDIAASSKVWEATLLGAIMGPAISTRAIAEFIRSSWKVTYPNFYVKDNGILVFRFSSVDDLNWVLEKGPWSIGGSRPILLKRWSDGLPMDWRLFRSVPVWVRLPDLPPLFNSREMLSRIGSGIGTPLCVDEFTASHELLAYSRLLVEVSVEQSRRTHVKLVNGRGEEVMQKVIFEWLPWSCAHCKCFGHTEAMCKMTRLDAEPLPSSHSRLPGAESVDKKDGKVDQVVEGQKQDGEAVSGSSLSQSGASRVCCRCLGNSTSADGAVVPPRLVCNEATQTGFSVGAAEDERVAESDCGQENAASTSAGSVGRISSGTQTEDGRDIVVTDDISDHETSLICARMVASSWAAASGILAKKDGQLEINKCKTPEFMRWKEVDGMKKGTYLLRGTKSCIHGDIRMSLTMDELFNTMAAIKDPNSGKGDAAHFMDESEIADTSTEDETYKPG